MATPEEILQALNENAGFKTNNKDWTKDTFTEKLIIPGKISLFYQTGKGEENTGDANFGFWYNKDIGGNRLEKLKNELHNILEGKGHCEVESDRYYAWVRIPDLKDKTPTWAVLIMQELERRILWEFSK